MDVSRSRLRPSSSKIQMQRTRSVCVCVLLSRRAEKANEKQKPFLYTHPRTQALARARRPRHARRCIYKKKLLANSNLTIEIYIYKKKSLFVHRLQTLFLSLYVYDNNNNIIIIKKKHQIIFTYSIISLIL